MVSNEKRHRGQSKRSGDVVDIDNIEEIADTIDLVDNLMIKELTNKDDSGIIELRLLGYTQAQIADMLGVSQPQISQQLAKIKKEWDRTHDR